MKKKAFMREIYKKYGQDKVLLIGFDIAKDSHHAGISNGYGDILEKPFEIDIYKAGYEMLLRKIKKAKEQTAAEVLIFGCEPSGHYYINLMTKLTEDFSGSHFVLIKTEATKSKREQMSESSKTDPIDTRAILDLMRNGDSYDFPRDEQIFKTINEYVRLLDRTTKDVVALKNRIHAYLDEIYPGLEKKLSNFTDTKYGTELLQMLPHPSRLKSMNPDEIIKMYKENNFKIGRKYAINLAQASSYMLITSDEAIEDKIQILKIIVKQYITLNESIATIEVELEKHLLKLPFSENLMEIDGIKVKSLSRIVAYLGNPYKFENGSKVSSFAGLNPMFNQSGKYAGRVTISRRGHSKLRQLLIQIAHIVVSNVGYFTAYNNRLIIENHKPPKVAIIATANKLLKVIMKMIHSGEKFSPPTAQDVDLSKDKIKRLTSKELKKIAKEKRLDSLTQSTVYLTRV